MVADYASLEKNLPEVSVIGSMLIDDRTVPMLMQELTPEHFTDGELRHVFEAIREIFQRHGNVDVTTVLGQLGDEGYAPKLIAVMDLTPTAANCMEYARILRDRRTLRQIQGACMEILSEGTDLDRAKELLAGAAGLLAERPNDRGRSYVELLADLLTRQADKTPPDYLDWGIEALNKKLHAGPGRFILLGADSSVGKTALALQFALAIAKAGKSVGFFSYETTLADAADRLAANDADVSLSRIKAKGLERGEIERIIQAATDFGEKNLYIQESARYTVDQLRAKTIAKGFRVIVIDYVQLIPTRRRERYDAVTEISIGLHAMAQELGVTVIGLSQVTVPETDKKGRRRYITKEDLRESRQLKQDADIILLLDLVEPTDPYGNRILQVAKNRDGPLGRVVLQFRPSRMRFVYVDPVESEADKKRREKLAAMDAKREAERQARADAADWKERQGDMFQDIDDKEDIPF